MVSSNLHLDPGAAQRGAALAPASGRASAAGAVSLQDGAHDQLLVAHASPADVRQGAHAAGRVQAQAGGVAKRRRARQLRTQRLQHLWQACGDPAQTGPGSAGCPWWRPVGFHAYVWEGHLSRVHLTRRVKLGRACPCVSGARCKSRSFAIVAGSHLEAGAVLRAAGRARAGGQAAEGGPACEVPDRGGADRLGKGPSPVARSKAGGGSSPAAARPRESCRAPQPGQVAGEL